MTKINFDEWSELYKTDPEEFENRRRFILEQEMLKAPLQYRNNLRLLQTECDIICEMYNPLEATVQISKLMTEKLDRLTENLKELKVKLDDFK